MQVICRTGCDSVEGSKTCQGNRIWLKSKSARACNSCPKIPGWLREEKCWKQGSSMCSVWLALFFWNSTKSSGFPPNPACCRWVQGCRGADVTFGIFLIFFSPSQVLGICRLEMSCQKFKLWEAGFIRYKEEIFAMRLAKHWHMFPREGMKGTDCPESGGYSIPGNIQGQAGCSSEQPDAFEDVPAHFRAEGPMWVFRVPSIPHYYMILWSTPKKGIILIALGISLA